MSSGCGHVLCRIECERRLNISLFMFHLYHYIWKTLLDVLKLDFYIVYCFRICRLIWICVLQTFRMWSVNVKFVRCSWYFDLAESVSEKCHVLPDFLNVIRLFEHTRKLCIQEYKFIKHRLDKHYHMVVNHGRLELRKMISSHRIMFRRDFGVQSVIP